MTTKRTPDAIGFNTHPQGHPSNLPPLSPEEREIVERHSRPPVFEPGSESRTLKEFFPSYYRGSTGRPTETRLKPETVRFILSDECGLTDLEKQVICRDFNIPLPDDLTPFDENTVSHESLVAIRKSCLSKMCKVDPIVKTAC